MRKNYSTTLDENLLKEIKKAAIDEGRDLNDILEEIIRKYLESKKKV